VPDRVACEGILCSHTVISRKSQQLQSSSAVVFQNGPFRLKSEKILCFRHFSFSSLVELKKIYGHGSPYMLSLVNARSETQCPWPYHQSTVALRPSGTAASQPK